MNLNSQYLVLIKNPRDQQQIAILASQMYPGNASKLLDAYRQAIERPYGYLVVDLKQSTPESYRLQTHIFRHYIKEDIQEFNNSLTSIQAGNISNMSSRRGIEHESQITRDSGMETDSKYPSCSDYGVMFGNQYNVQRHVRRDCPMYENSEEKMDTDGEDDDEGLHCLMDLREKITKLARRANRLREKTRPKQPADLEFMVYKVIVSLLPHAPQVKVIVMNFEAAMWAAARPVLPTCILRGCACHWAQAVPNTKMDGIHKFIRLLMALPYLPKEHILPAFQRLRDSVLAKCKTQRRLCRYMESTWMTSRTFPVSCWTLPLQLKLVAEKKLTRNQRSNTKRTQAKIFELWGQYANNDIRIMELLRSLGQLVGPILD
ncbi:hypothetical protein FSP39_004781 [Pinctada imbricata]|uniref:Uncharacterized protein n=1 Tax=Pinctada imbricata TaxID=66713 RepID=A0AA89BVE1_PINIB|nr:hypothetical protein FSP39_004781 [Pinctada imbricata]